MFQHHQMNFRAFPINKRIEKVNGYYNLIAQKHTWDKDFTVFYPLMEYQEYRWLYLRR